MNTCGICEGELDWSGSVGEIETREWFAGRAVAWKSFICIPCYSAINNLIAIRRPSKV